MLAKILHKENYLGLKKRFPSTWTEKECHRYIMIPQDFFTEVCD